MKKIIFLTILVLSVYIVMLSYSAKAQTGPVFLTTWKAYNFSPLDFQGKNFPIENTAVRVSFELIENGKRVDLSNKEVRWIIDDKWEKVEKGLKTYIFIASNIHEMEHEVRIQIPDYYAAFSEESKDVAKKFGEQASRTLDYLFYIPLVNPKVSITNPIPQQRILLAPASIIVRAKPFFFNVFTLKDLVFKWTSNGQSTQGQPEDPDILKINFEMPEAKQGNLNISLSVANPKELTESANGNLNLRVQRK